MYGTQMFGHLVCGVAIAIGSPSFKAGGGYGTQEFGQYWSTEGGAGIGVVAPVPPPVFIRSGTNDANNYAVVNRWPDIRKQDEDEIATIIGIWFNIK